MLVQEDIGSNSNKEMHELGKQFNTGFSSSAPDHFEDQLNLHEYLVRNKSATFFCRIRGAEEEQLGFYDGDLLIVDRSLAFKHHSFVIAEIKGELRVCRLLHRGKYWTLKTGNNKFINLESDELGGDLFWGVVSHVIHPCI